MFLSGFTRQSTVITTATAGSITAPVGAISVTVEAIGGGGNGFGNATTANRASGGGGRYAQSLANISVTGGSTIVYYFVGPVFTQSWVNVGTNAAPTLASTGCLAPGGTSGGSALAGSGSFGTAIGAVTRNGGNGATGTNSQGGGGSGATTAGSSATAGTDTTGLSVLLMGGGTGGTYNNATTGPGTAPGGGGGAASVTGTNYAGAIGRVRITFYG